MDHTHAHKCRRIVLMQLCLLTVDFGSTFQCGWSDAICFSQQVVDIGCNDRSCCVQARDWHWPSGAITVSIFRTVRNGNGSHTHTNSCKSNCRNYDCLPLSIADGVTRFVAASESWVCDLIIVCVSFKPSIGVWFVSPSQFPASKRHDIGVDVNLGTSLAVLRSAK